MPESFASKLARWKFNFFPAYRGTGARVDYIASNWREVRIRLPLSWRTRNLVGTIFGGSMYGAIDPMYMFMLIHNLGRDYIVWDKAAAIRFKKPSRSTLYEAHTVAPLAAAVTLTCLLLAARCCHSVRNDDRKHAVASTLHTTSNRSSAGNRGNGA